MSLSDIELEALLGELFLPPVAAQPPALPPLPAAPPELIPPQPEEAKLSRLPPHPLFTDPATGEVKQDTTKYFNAETGKIVSATGRVGKKLERERAEALVREGKALQKGPSLREAGRAAYQPAGPPRANGAFRTQRYHVPGEITSINKFANTLYNAAKHTPNYVQAVVQFTNEDGDVVTRTLHGGPRGRPSAAGFAKELEGLMLKGSVPTSDGEIETEYFPDINTFTIGYFSAPRAGGLKFNGISSKQGRRSPFFRLLDFSMKAKDGDCFFATLRAVAKAAGIEKVSSNNNTLRKKLGLGEGAVPMESKTVDELARIFGLHVRVIEGVTAPPDCQRHFDDNGTRETARNRCDTETSLLVTAEGGAVDAPDCPVYYADGHCEYIAEFYNVKTCPVTGDVLTEGPMPIEKQRERVLQQGRRWYAAMVQDEKREVPEGFEEVEEEERPRPKKGKTREKFIEKVIVLDYETFYRDDGMLEPYALGYCVLDSKDLEGRGDFSGQQGRVNLVLRSESSKDRFDVTRPLLDLLFKEESGMRTRYTLVTFNGARFDNYILAAAALNDGYLNKVFATPSGGLRSLSIGRHITLDLAKMIPAMSLSSCCSEFKTSPKKVEGFSHEIPQQEYFAGKLYSWMHENASRLAEYLSGDVLSTASLLVKARKAFIDATKTDFLDPTKPQTIGGVAWEMMKTKCPLPKAVQSQETDLFIRRAIVGGRVQVYANGPTVVKSAKPLYMGDFVSLYPTVMAAVKKCSDLFPAQWKWGWYPSEWSGEPEEVKEYNEGDVGVYEVKIKRQPPGKPNVMAKRAEGEALDWSYQGEIEAVVSHIDIALIRGNGGEVEVVRGLRWENSMNGLMSDFIEELAKLKNEQDKFKESSSDKYNAALRMVYKLLMNAASGKTCQKNYDDNTVLATGEPEQRAALKKMSEDELITVIPLNGQSVLICGKKLKDKIYRPKKAKPAIIAVLIYAYARSLLWQTMCQHGVMYSDTDSGLFTQENWNRLKASFPALFAEGRSKELGDIEEELKAHHHASAYLLAPKMYAVFPKDEQGRPLKKQEKIRAKGVNLRSDRVLLDAEVESAKAMAENGQCVEALAAEYRGKDGGVSTRIADDPEGGFFEKLAQGPVHVLCSQITRQYRDRNTPGFHLRQRFLVKEIQLSQK